MIQLEAVTDANWREGLNVRATAPQARYVAGYEPVLLVILAKSAVLGTNNDGELQMTLPQ